MTLGRVLLCGCVLLLTNGANVASAASLGLSLATDKGTYSTADEIKVTITLTNISSMPVVLPQLTAANQATYLSLQATLQSGIAVFFFSPLDLDIAQGDVRATNTQVLQSGESVVFNILLNQGGGGPLGYTIPGQPSSLQVLSGALSLVASFEVNVHNQPTGGDPNVFQGIVTSADSSPPLVVTTVSKLTGDLNADGKVDCSDLGIVRAAFGRRAGDPGYDPRADVNSDGVVDIRDLSFVAQKLPAGMRCP